ncbi:MAG: TonB-dependent receptor [Alphaproteobacteria bacterium]|nr:TonB-dependent receptor [Alphaproteobacteria bacterium]
MKKLSLYAATALVGLGSLNANAQSIDYDMMESIFGEKVTASATGKPQRVSDAPVDMVIIGQEEIEKSGAQDIPQLLRKYAGISVNRAAKGQADVNVRGYNSTYSNKLLVLVNGRQVYQDFFGFTSWDFLPVQLSEIRQIEVVKGPNTSLFGLNAESGVVNIITYSPLKDDITSVEVKYGTQNQKEAIGIVTAKPADNFALRLSAEAKSSDTFDLSEDLVNAGFDEGNGLTKHTYNMDAEWQIDDSTNLRLQAGEVKGKHMGTVPALLNFETLRKRNRYIQSTLIKDSNLGLLKLNAYHNDSEDDAMGITNILDVVQFEDLYKFNKDNTFRAGLEYRSSEASGAGLGYGDLSAELMGFAGMWEHIVNDKLTLTNSARLDHLTYEKSKDQTVGNNLSKEKFDQTFDAFSFNTGAVYKLNDLETLRFSAGRGLHLPSLLEIGGDTDGSIDIVGNPNLDPEVLWSAELGYTKVLPEIKGKVKSTVFYQYIEDYIAKTITSAVPSVSVPELTAQNAGSSEAMGLELSYDAKYNQNIGYGSSYTFTYTKDHPDIANAMFDEDNNNKHKVALWADYQKDKLYAYAEAIWNSSVNYYSQTKLLGDPVVSESLDSYITLNANVSYDVTKNAKVSLSGYNLLDEHNEYATGYDALTGMSHGGNELGRSALVSFKYKF